MKTLKIFLFALLIANVSMAQKPLSQTEERQRVALEMVTAFKEGISDDLIINRFSINDPSERSDSVKRFTKEYIEGLRKTYDKIPANNIAVVKYLEHPERLYKKSDQNKPLVFSYYTFDKKLLTVDANDVYIVIDNRKEKEAIQFVLFNADSKIISFACWRVGSNATFSPI